MEFVDGLSTLTLDRGQPTRGRIVDVSRETPERWQKAMDRAGLSSMRRLAAAVGVHTSTISAMIHGDRDTSPETVAKVAEVLGVDVVRVSRWVGQARTVAAPYQPPAEAALLTARQRKAVDELIRSMTEREESTHGASTRQADDRDGQVHKIPTPPTLDDIKAGRAAAGRGRPRPKGERRS